MQVTQEELNEAIHCLCNFDLCGLVSPAIFIITVRVWAMQGLLLLIPQVYQNLPLHMRAVCTFRMNIWGQIMYLHMRQSK